MNLRYLIDMLSWVECFVCIGSLAVILVRRQMRSFLYLTLFLAVRLFADLTLGTTLMLRWKHLNMPVAFYRCYFYVYWVSYALEAALLLMAVYGIYKLAMAPLPGLQRLGSLVFRWAAAISIAVSIGLAFGPHVSGMRFVIRAVSQLQQTSSILTLCLLLFVCFAIRPMGLSYRSRVFGVSLGLGLLATTNLVASAWIVSNKDMYSPLNMINGLAICASFVVWIGYFAMPEPKRRMIVLPTTSPFLRWNQISQALGDEPGYVAIAGVPPDMFAEAEIEVMERASRKMADYPEMA
ncbi:hypothetical protein [Granulicella sibirica]|uniref:Uncharacterized protein n=1 Tax=Granulicella sibirica TaxID=2479048 RepID=A0A4Q0T4K4_9BACT|nr:hypothetical protein [Granulicella sibirica]RXH58665.1 hypothetical protein GRAN_1975 [Granulicella sibirica]